VRSFDVIVLGLGGMGSAAAHHLAKRGARVLGLEQFSLAHALGSSHGETRLIRKSYLTDTAFIPLLHRSYELWEELERASSARHLFRTGLLFVERHAMPAEAEALAARHGVEIEAIDAAEARRRFPQFRIPDGCKAYFEPDAGYVTAEPSIEAHCRLAAERGAMLAEGEGALSWSESGGGVEVITSKGIYRAGALVVTAGPWSQRILGDLGIPLLVRRIPQTWFSAGELHRADRGAPCFIFDLDDGFFYGVPDVGHGRMKIAGGGARDIVTDPSDLDRRLRADDLLELRRFVRDCVSGVPLDPVAHSMCMCTMTPDERFIIDIHPAHPRVAFAAGFSGHGFKFAPAVGEALADLALSGRVPASIDFLRVRRRAPLLSWSQ
jgi:sarcosine oxidase